MQIPLLQPVVNNVTQKPKTWLIGLLAVGLVGGVIGFQGIRRQRESEDKLTALTVPVQSSDVALQVQGTGTIQPIRNVNVSPKVAGRVQQLFFDQGDQVRSGQVIAKMDDQDVRAEVAQSTANLQSARARLLTLRSPSRSEAVAQARAGVVQANASVDQALSEARRTQSEVTSAQSEVIRANGAVADAQAKLDLAKTKLKRQRQLAAAGAISQNSLDEFVQQAKSAEESMIQAKAQRSQAQSRVAQAQAQVKQAAARVAQVRAQRDSAQAQRNQQNTLGSAGEISQAQAQVDVAAAQLQAAQNRLNETAIRAPFDGVITQRYATVGAFVTPTTQASAAGSGATSTSIFGLANGLEVLARVPEVDIARIRAGQVVEIRADAYPDQKFEGTVQRIAPEAVNEQSVTYFQVRVKIQTGLDKLRSGMNVDLNFTGDQLNNATLVPTVAIVTKKGQAGVLVPGKDNKPEFKPIEIGASVKDQTQVLSGIAEGDRIFQELPPGLKLDQILKKDEKK
ncbi:efflux RND transporter periplasmic adaptor subunit [filamentous cyanobacterium LEGE 11480]|uniref:Efflux RND transporter periplasmic adaptor subunit n=1 Tax=Romeriopsis navalis LEGE 11480 TaxID=2777977 RepID=A0A928VLE0_9CYAN|nr:efflux RND transporter periplasmic adaptor subunit [Romeriopsis navalis]MBE9030696.1 efflux RND transporter periplasmic adaptor subunit [Romeriopsis navalis LEGE 11480]